MCQKILCGAFCKQMYTKLCQEETEVLETLRGKKNHNKTKQEAKQKSSKCLTILIL